MIESTGEGDGGSGSCSAGGQQLTMNETSASCPGQQQLNKLCRLKQVERVLRRPYNLRLQSSQDRQLIFCFRISEGRSSPACQASLFTAYQMSHQLCVLAARLHIIRDVAMPSRALSLKNWVVEDDVSCRTRHQVKSALHRKEGRVRRPQAAGVIRSHRDLKGKSVASRVSFAMADHSAGFLAAGYDPSIHGKRIRLDSAQGVTSEASLQTLASPDIIPEQYMNAKPSCYNSSFHSYYQTIFTRSIASSYTPVTAFSLLNFQSVKMSPGATIPSESRVDSARASFELVKSSADLFANPSSLAVQSPARFKVYVIDPYHPDAISLLQSYSNLDVVLNTDPAKSGWHSDADALIVRSDSRLTAEDFARAQRLRVVVKQGVGVDNIDLGAASQYGIAVHNTPALNSESVAELSMTLTLALSRRVCEVDRAVRNGERVVRNNVLGTSMFRKVIGVVGMGNIGKHIAKKWIGAFECTIIAYDPYAPTSAWHDLEHMRVSNLDDLLRVADVVTLHCPLVESTKGLISDRQLDIMKSTSFLINCARGGVVDEAALLRALHGGKIGGAALDVQEIEPPTVAIHGDFLQYANVILTPHIGGSTRENQSNSGRSVIFTLMDVLEGREATGKLV
nr:d-3-phosphoglycerate dehydrogenase [Quercus suber]